MAILLNDKCYSKEGVKFQSPHDGQKMLLTPEKSTEIQNSIGADIIMQLDDVVSSTTTGDVLMLAWRLFDPLSPNSNPSQISHCTINGLSVREVMRILT